MHQFLPSFHPSFVSSFLPSYFASLFLSILFSFCLLFLWSFLLSVLPSFLPSMLSFPFIPSFYPLFLLSLLPPTCLYAIVICFLAFYIHNPVQTPNPVVTFKRLLNEQKTYRLCHDNICTNEQYFLSFLVSWIVATGIALALFAVNVIFIVLKYRFA